MRGRIVAVVPAAVTATPGGSRDAAGLPVAMDELVGRQPSPDEVGAGSSSPEVAMTDDVTVAAPSARFARPEARATGPAADVATELGRPAGQRSGPAEPAAEQGPLTPPPGNGPVDGESTTPERDPATMMMGRGVTSDSITVGGASASVSPAHRGRCEGWQLTRAEPHVNLR